jgi:prevent-host-death family protein
MSITTLTSREFNQDSSRAKKAAKNGPVFITDRGKPAHVLLSIVDYQRLAGRQIAISQLLAMADSSSVEFNPPKAGIQAKSADLA